MIGLVDFLKAAGIEMRTNSLKVHLASWNGKEHPLDVYYAGKFKEWQEWQSRSNFECAQIISLIDLGNSDWLFTGVYKVLGQGKSIENSKDVLYSTEILPAQEGLIGRIIVNHKRSRASYIWYKPGVSLPIAEIRREKLNIQEFPGYNAVVVSHSKLKIITDQKIPSWHAALANIKGIYLITDTKTGKHYVGKASGSEGIWQRWCSYALNGHGGNKGLKEVLENEGRDHVRHFQFSILEIADTRASDSDILAREWHWMVALRSRDHGLNVGT